MVDNTRGQEKSGLYDSPVKNFATRSTAKERQVQLQEAIMDLVLSKELGPGDPMPTEQQLIEELGVGRNSLREALKVLESIGVVEVRHGFGTFVSGKALKSMTRGLTFRGKLSLNHGGREALELSDVRQALETGLIGLAVPLISQENIAELERAVEGMQESMSKGESWSHWDQRFHAALYASMDNQVLSELLDVFWRVYNNISETLDRVAPTTETQMGELVDTHRQLLEAVKAENAALATELMGAHFQGIRSRLARWGELAATTPSKTKAEEG